MKKIYFSGLKNCDKYVLVDDENYDELSCYKWYLSNHGYARRNNWVDKKNVEVKMHHQLFGKPRKGMLVDHINGDTTDNRRCNLRMVNNSENGSNCSISRRNKSGFKGVWARTKDGKIIGWRTSIMKNRKVMFRGSFKNKEDAFTAYLENAKIIFGEFARTDLDTITRKVKINI